MSAFLRHSFSLASFGLLEDLLGDHSFHPHLLQRKRISPPWGREGGGGSERWKPTRCPEGQWTTRKPGILKANPIFLPPPELPLLPRWTAPPVWIILGGIRLLVFLRRRGHSGVSVLAAAAMRNPVRDTQRNKADCLHSDHFRLFHS